MPALIGRVGLRTTVAGCLAILAGGLGWLSMAPADAAFAANLLGPSLLLGIGSAAVGPAPRNALVPI